MIALLEAYRAKLLTRTHWLPNLIAGLVVGIVALPLSMAFAVATGVRPEQGIYTAIIAGLSVSLFGGSRVQISGPTGACIVVLLSIVTDHGMAGLQLATIMAGVILLLFGLARMGGVIKFIPDPVISGFTGGIGVAIFVGQWKDFFGLPAVTSHAFHEKFWGLLQELPELHLPTTALALLSLFILIFSNRIPKLKRIPGPLIAMVTATLIQTLFQFEGVATIQTTFGGIPPGLPALTLPTFSLTQVLPLIGPAFAIALLGAIESLLSAVVADGMTGTKHHSNQELIGQGIANILAPLFGGIASTGAIARTATNLRNGGNSPLAGVIHVGFLILVLLFLAPLTAHIPLATLAAILFMVAWNMSGIKHCLKLLRRAPRTDVFILLLTFLLTLFVDLIVAVNTGVLLSVLAFLRRMAKSVEVTRLTDHAFAQEFAHTGVPPLPSDVLVYTVEGPFFFGAVEVFEQALAQTHTDPKVIILRLKWVPFIDLTGLQSLEEVIQDLQSRGVRVLLAGANQTVEAKLQKAGILRLLGEDNYFKGFGAAISACHLPEGPIA